MDKYFSRFLMAASSTLVVLIWYPFALGYVANDAMMVLATLIGAVGVSAISGALASAVVHRKPIVLVLFSQLLGMSLVTLITWFG